MKYVLGRVTGVNKKGQNKLQVYLICLFLLLAVFARSWGLNYDLPYIYHPDEPLYISQALTMFKTGDLNPHNFINPPFVVYINALAYDIYFLLGKLLGFFQERSELLPLIPLQNTMGMTLAPSPTIVLLGRSMAVLLGVGTIGLTFLIGKRLTGKWSVGCLAALFAAVSSLNVAHSRFVTPDPLVVFFVTAAFLAVVMIYNQGKLLFYILAGLCIGFAAASKYYGGLMVLPLLAAHFLRYGKKGFKEKNIYLGLCMCGLGFLITNPYALLDFFTFWSDLIKGGKTYATGHTGMEGNTIRWYLTFMWQTAGLIYLLAVLEIVRGMIIRSKEIILLSSFPIFYFVFISRFSIRNDRTLLTLTPFIFLLAASFLVFLLEKAGQIQSQGLRRLTMGATVFLTILALIQPIRKTAENIVQVSKEDSRETARIWINANIPTGAKIALESYAPFIDPVRFSVEGVPQMIDHPPHWYIENGFEYLVFGQDMYRRYFAEPEKYPTQVSQYNSFFDQFTLLRKFTDGGYEVLVYQTR